MYSLGLMSSLTTLQHDGSAVLMKDSKVIFAIEEERLSRNKHAISEIPINSIKAALKYKNLQMKDIKSVHVSSTSKDLKKRVESYLIHHFGYSPDVILENHHLCHMASSFFHSGFKESMIVSIDGVGDKVSTALGFGRANKIKILETKGLVQSLGIFYQTMTQLLGFNSVGDEYKLMGISAYGKKRIDLDKIIKLESVDFKINKSFYRKSLTYHNFSEPRYDHLFINNKKNLKRRYSSEKFDNIHKNLAYSIQAYYEDAIISLVKKLFLKTGISNLCLAGGCALNSVANMKLSNLHYIDNIFIQPAASDQGTALGAVTLGAVRKYKKIYPIKSYYLGQNFSDNEILEELKLFNVKFRKINNRNSLVAKSLSKGKVVGLFQGRSEFGPRALGNRSILANPNIKNIKGILNRKIKFREDFRPFAPTVMQEFANDIFEIKNPSPYMTLTTKVKKKWRNKIAGVVHIDGTSRVQTLNKAQNKDYYEVINKFYSITKIPLVLNTSFNIKGEPIVENPKDAIRTFFGSGIDELYIGNYLVIKK